MKHLIAFMFLIAFMSLVLFSCTQHTAEVTKSYPSIATQNQLVVAGGIDISGSMKEWAELDTNTIQRLVTLVGQRNGVLAFGHIKSESYSKLVRLDLKLDTVEVVGRLSERAAIVQRNDQIKAQYQQKINNALQRIQHSVNLKRTEQKSDIIGCLERFRLFFNEPQFEGWDKVLVVYSDGEYQQKPDSTDIPQAALFTVGMRTELAKANFGQSVISFEGFSGVIDYLQSNSPHKNNINNGG